MLLVIIIQTDCFIYYLHGHSKWAEPSPELDRCWVVQKIPVIYRTRRFAVAHYWTLFQVSWKLSFSTIGSDIIIPSRLWSSNCQLTFRSETEMLHARLLCLSMLQVPLISFSLIWTCSANTTDYGTPHYLIFSTLLLLPPSPPPTTLHTTLFSFIYNQWPTFSVTSFTSM